MATKPETSAKPDGRVGVENPWLAQFQEYYSEFPDLPNVEIHFEALRYAVEVSKAQHSIETVGSAALKLATLAPLRSHNKVDFPILDNITGAIRPGTSTLIIAPPGHGKTSLLKTLAGRLPASAFTGSLTYNGRTLEDTPFDLKHLIGFVEQGDVHLPHLTVRETFQFALNNMAVDPSLLPTEKLREQHANRVQKIIEALNLEECSETIVGNALVRGISGGQRRRTTVGEMLVTNARVLMLDEFSTGLDAATTIDVARMLQAWAQASQGSVVTAMLQPPPEAFAMFDDIILLRNGCVVYHGPREELPEFLTGQGVPLPTDQDLADFLTEFLTDPKLATFNVLRRQAEDAELGNVAVDDVDATTEPVETINEDEETSNAEATPVRAVSTDRRRQSSAASSVARRRMTSTGSSTGAPVVDEAALVKRVNELGLTTDKLSERFHASDLFKRQLQAAKESVRIPQVAPSSFAEAQYTKARIMSFGQYWKHNFKRQVRLMSQEKQLIAPRIGQSIMLGLIVGSLFYQLGVDEFTLKIGLLLYVSISLSFSNFAEVPLASEYKKVVYKQVDAGFYPASSYLTSLIVVHLPLAIAEVFILGSFVYWFADLSNSAGRYFVFLGLLLLMNLAMSTIFRLFAYITPAMELAQVCAGPYTSLSLLFGGFLITREKIPDFLIWAYWTSPFSWITRALTINELHSDEYQDTVPGTGKILGDIYLEAYEFQTDDNYIWAGAIFLAFMFVLGMVLGVLALEKLRFSSARGTSRDADEDEDALKVGMGSEDGASAASAMPFQEMTLTFEDIKYTVPIGKGKTKMLLRGVTGYAKPGQMTALMGSSGAGKTTLMDVLAGRKTKGEIEGSIRLNGYPKEQDSFARIAGYVEQDDIHMASSTVRESLEFSAKLRLPASVTAETRSKFVSEVLTMLELDDVANRLIGDDVIAGLSPGQLKRVTIGVELVTNPAIIFLDEPTSGLDSRAAATVMRVIRRIASTGRTVICTIHQPSADLFYMFDNMLLLQSGGYQVFNGPLGYRACELVNYLESLPETLPLPGQMNPATWMLDVLGGGQILRVRQASAGGEAASPAPAPAPVPAEGGEYEAGVRFSTAWDASELAEQTKAVVREFSEPKADSRRVEFKGNYNSSIFAQLKATIARQWIAHWRNPAFNLMRLIVITLLGVVFGLVYFDLDTSDQPGTTSLLAVIMVVAAFIGVINNLTGLPVFVKQRALYYRERSSNTYSSFAYAVALGIVEIPWVALNTLTFCCTWYWLVGLEADAEIFFRFYFAFFLTSVVFVYFGQLFASLMPDANVAQIAESAFISTFFLFAGVFIPEPDIPSGWKWYFHANPVSHALEALVMPQVQCEANDSTCPMIDVPTKTGVPNRVRQDLFVANYTGFEFDSYWTQVGYLFMYIGIFFVLTVLCLKYIRHISR